MPSPSRPAQASVQTYHRLTVALATLGVLLGTIALVLANVALIRRPNVPSYSEPQKNAAQVKLCDSYKLASKAVSIATNIPDVDVAVARLSLTNGTLMLQTAAVDPALDPGFREPARALADAYQIQSANGITAAPEQYQETIANTNSRTFVMIGLCGD